MLSCYLYRRRIDANLDGALDSAAARSIANHLTRCEACSAEANGLRRLKTLLSRRADVAEPDWAGFWPGVVRGIQDARSRPPLRATPSWVRFRWAYGGALAAALLVSITLWQFVPEPQVPSAAKPSPEGPIIVTAAHTDYPGGKVMVYSTPEKDLTVVWVFGLDQ